MIIECEKCRTRFRLEDSRIYERSLKVQCSRCDHVFIVPALTSGVEAEAGVESTPSPQENEAVETHFKEEEPASGPAPDEEESMALEDYGGRAGAEREAESEPETPAREDIPLSDETEESALPEDGEEAPEETVEEGEGSETPPADDVTGGFSTPVTTGTFLYSREEGGEAEEDSAPEEERREEETGVARDVDARTGTTDDVDDDGTTPVEEKRESGTLPQDLTIVPGETIEEDLPAPLEEGTVEDDIMEEVVTEPPAPSDAAQEAVEEEGGGYVEAETMGEAPGEETWSGGWGLEESVDEERATEKEAPGGDDGNGANDSGSEAGLEERDEPVLEPGITRDEALEEEQREVEGKGKKGEGDDGEVVYDLDAWEDELRKSQKGQDFSFDLVLSEEGAGDKPEEADGGGLETGRPLTFEIGGGGEEAAGTIEAKEVKEPHDKEPPDRADEERAGSPSLSSPSSSGPSRGKAFAAIIAALAIGVFVAWGLTSGKLPAFLSTGGAQQKIMEIGALKGFFVMNKNMGKVFVIEAQVKNITDKAQETGGVRGVIYHGRFSGALYSPTISPGRVLSTDEIKDLSERDLKRIFNGASRAVIPPRGTIPVMIIFTGLRDAVSEYGIDVMK